MGCDQKSFKLWVVSEFMAKGHLPRMSHQSRLSANDKGDHEIFLGAEHKSPGIYLTAEENPENLSLESVDEGCATSHRLKWGPFPTDEVGRISQHVMRY